MAKTSTTTILVEDMFEGDYDQLQDTFGYSHGDSLEYVIAYLESIVNSTGKPLNITVIPDE